MFFKRKNKKEINPSMKENKIVAKSYLDNVSKTDLVEKETVRKTIKVFDEENVILDKYKGLKTPELIIKWYDKKKYISGIMFYENNNHFVKKSIEYSNKQVEFAKHILFFEYFPNFKSLKSEDQLNWYIYWRNNFLNNKILETSLSYIFLFAYELMHYSFNRRIEVNLSLLEKLLIDYKDEFPKLQNYIPNWIRDLIMETGSEKRRYFETEKYNKTNLMKILESSENSSIKNISLKHWEEHIKYNKLSLPNDILMLINIRKTAITNRLKKYLGIAALKYKRTGGDINKYWFREITTDKMFSPFRSMQLLRPSSVSRHGNFYYPYKTYTETQKFQETIHDCILLSYWDVIKEVPDLESLKSINENDLSLFIDYRPKNKDMSLSDIKELKLKLRDNGVKSGNKYKEEFKFLINKLVELGTSIEQIEETYLLSKGTIKKWSTSALNDINVKKNEGDSKFDNLDSIELVKLEKEDINLNEDKTINIKDYIKKPSVIHEEKEIKEDNNFNELDTIEIKNIEKDDQKVIKINEEELINMVDSEGIISKSKIKKYAMKKKKFEKSLVKELNLKYYDLLNKNILEEDELGYILNLK